MVRVEQAEFQGRSPPPVMDAAPSPPTYRSLNGKQASNAGERGQLNGAPRTSYSTIAKTNDVEQEITPIPPEASHNLSRLQIILLGIVVASAYIVWGILISLQPPFYPLEAEKKGAEPHQYGFVFGIFNLGAFMGGPIFGRFGSKVGPRVLYTVGGFAQGICGILFGLLAYVDNVNAFVGLSYFLRLCAGFADAAGWGAVLTILLKLFPTKVPVIMSYTEGFFGVGFMIGPALGSILYEAGGFTLPFTLVGGIGVLVATSMIFVIPHVEPEQRTASTDKPKQLTFKKILTSPTIFVPFIDNACCFFGNGFLEGMLQPHIHAAGGSVTDGGIAFFMQGCIFMIGMVACGYVCDMLPNSTVMSIAGNSCLALAFTLVGPLPWMSLEPTVGLMKGSMALVGAGYACIMVSTFARAQGAAARMGYPKDIDTYLLISGMWTSSLYLGCFAGPTLAGFMVERIGFRSTTVLFWAVYLLILLIDMLESGYFMRQSQDQYLEEKIQRLIDETLHQMPASIRSNIMDRTTARSGYQEIPETSPYREISQQIEVY